MSTLFVTAILLAVFVEFAYSVYISVARAGNFSESERAGLLAGNGVELARAALKEFLKSNPNITMDAQGLVLTRDQGDATIVIRIVDEMGKASTRVVYEKTGVKNDLVHGIYSRLLIGMGIEDRLRLENTLADWIDADDEPRIYGAERADWYGVLDRPYGPRNGYLESLDEALMIKDYSPGAFGRISPFITAYSREGHVNVNTARKEVLMALSDGMTDELAMEMIAYRKKTPFKDRSDIMRVPGFDKIGFSLQDRIAVTSDIFRVFSKATVGTSTREVEAVIQAGKGVLYWREM